MNNEEKIIAMLETLTEKVEQHGEMLGTLAKKGELSLTSRVEALEADVTMLKDAYKLLRQEVNELKKAQ